MGLDLCHLTSYGGGGLSGLLSLMQIQNTYIQKLHRAIYLVGTDISIASHADFQEFVAQFQLFAQYHAGSEGFGRAIDAVQVYYHMLLEKLLDTQILSAAEALEIAISHLEAAMREPKIRANLQVALLHDAISLLEETELKIIETLESILEGSRCFLLQN